MDFDYDASERRGTLFKRGRGRKAPFLCNKKSDMKARTDWFFSFHCTPVKQNRWGFWSERQKILPQDRGTTLIIINFGWRNIGFFYFKETI